MINPKPFFLILYFSCSLFFSKAQTAFSVVELFTSEGCSSCPPADKVLSAVKAEAEKNNKNIFCLEYHVDYWNKLGWKDPYSSFQYTLRQKNYVSVLNEESVYTPMMVVNGSETFTGSDEGKAKTSIASALAVAPDIQLSVKVDSMETDTLFINYKCSKEDKNFYIRVAITQSGLVSEVTKGENSGKKLIHDGVVRVFFSADARKDGLIKVPLKKFLPDKNCRLVAFIQHKQTMKILAAYSTEF